jgi:hypothetical protein
MKKCFKCGIEKPLSEFYTHGKMADGHLNKCKECTKKDSDLRDKRLRDDPVYCEKERTRSKEKYYRLNYKDRQYAANKNIPYKTSEYKKIHKKLGLPGDKVAHHWNYDLMYDVIILTVADHRYIHRYLRLNKLSLTFTTKEGVDLNTKKEHVAYIERLLNKRIRSEFSDFVLQRETKE